MPLTIDKILGWLLSIFGLAIVIWRVVLVQRKRTGLDWGIALVGLIIMLSGDYLIFRP
jgi:hypothetical protein